MLWKQITTMNFSDPVSGDEAYVSVRTYAGAVGLTLSLRQDGDAEVFFGRGECEALIAALQQGLADLQSDQP